MGEAGREVEMRGFVGLGQADTPGGKSFVGLGQTDAPGVGAQGARSVPDRVLPPPGFLSRLTSVKVWRGTLPHWEKPGVAVFVTLRLGDSLPMDKLGPFQEDRRVWLEQHPQPWNEVDARE